MSEPKISQAKALAIAQEVCQERGWPWLEPVRVEARAGVWVVRTNTQARGANARIMLSQEDGRLLEAVYLPR